MTCMSAHILGACRDHLISRDGQSAGDSVHILTTPGISSVLTLNMGNLVGIPENMLTLNGNTNG